MSEVAVVLICDVDYIIPTLSAALSARKHISLPGVDVVLYVLGEAPSWSSQFQKKISCKKIRLEWVSIPELDDLSKYHRDRYLPPITLARFWLNDLLSSDVTKFLYIDGDVMVDNSLDELLVYSPPLGKIAAAPDNIQLFRGEWSAAGKTDSKYLASISVNPSRYLNAGVIYSLSSTWSSVAERAVKFMKENPQLCRSSDQSAINYVCAGDAIVLSQRYNFQSEHMMVLGGRKLVPPPVIYHFTGGPKPWVDPSWPWGEYFNQYYREAERICAEFDLVCGATPHAQTQAGIKHRRRFRFRQRWLYPWRKIVRRRALAQLLRAPNRIV